jgi:hypothetical protein
MKESHEWVESMKAVKDEEWIGWRVLGLRYRGHDHDFRLNYHLDLS